MKYKADGSIECYKGRLIFKVLHKPINIKFEEIFAPITKLNTIRVILSIVVNMNWKLHQMNVKKAFLSKELTEEVYIEGPLSLEIVFGKKMCKLNKYLYRLKQSPRAWFEKSIKAIKRYCYIQCQTDHTLFVKHSMGNVVTVIILYNEHCMLI